MEGTPDRNAEKTGPDNRRRNIGILAAFFAISNLTMGNFQAEGNWLINVFIPVALASLLMAGMCFVAYDWLTGIGKKNKGK